MTDPNAPHAGHSLNYSHAVTQARPNGLVRTGGALGIAGSCLGLLIFLTACAGFDAAFALAILPLLLGAVGLVMALVGALRKGFVIEDTHVLAAFFTTSLALIGGIIEFAVFRGSRII